MMTTQVKIDRLKERLLALEATMAKSDAHLCKCAKLGVTFAETYPAEYEEYKAANEEYNKVELELEELQAQLDNEAPAHPEMEEHDA